MNMSNRKKSLSEGEKLILMQNDTTLLLEVFGINLNIHVQYSTVIKSCMLGPTVINLKLKQAGLVSQILLHQNQSTMAVVT